jgi:predicted acylesterase/phospholipase RssA
MVTGISTGALTAPFAFLGPAYDATLKEVYTTTRTRDVIRERGIISGALFDDALADTRPLRALLRRYITPELLSAIARENERGRLLLVATTNLDSQRSVIWNIGAIASCGRPGSLDLVRDVLLASAAIPVAFPPVLIDVQVDGKTYQEMHVDGGAASQLFLYPPSFELLAETETAGVERERRGYLIRNAPLDADRRVVPRQTLSIAERAISSLIQTQGHGDLYRLYATSQRDGVEFNLAFIPGAFNASYDEPFDPVYMQKLFETGYRAAVEGYPWSKAPPGFDGHDPHEQPAIR